MEDESGFDRIEGKVPRRDKEGNDITGDNLAGGGYHRDDGTFSGMAYDLGIKHDNDSGSGKFIAGFILGAGAVGVAIAALYVKSWWQENAFPSLKKKWARNEDLDLSATDEGYSQAATAELATLSKLRLQV